MPDLLADALLVAGLVFGYPAAVLTAAVALARLIGWKDMLR